MRVFESLAAVPPDFGQSAVTIGKFDGVHAGHRRVIAGLVEIAAASHLVGCVVTFDRHPLSLLRPELCPEPLISNDQKAEMLAELGTAALLVLPFDRALSQLTADEFVRTVVAGALHARVVLIGADFRFGAGGAGDVKLLRSLGAELGFEVRIVDDVCADDGRRASSTWIRELLLAGRVEEAAELLGYPHRVRATVVPGKHRGRDLGYPTANLSPETEGLVPADGVYAAWAKVGDTRYPSAISIGTNPTFEHGAARRVEAFLLDFDHDLYGSVIELSFVDRVRGMERFEQVPDLVAQMKLDVKRVREILAAGQF